MKKFSNAMLVLIILVVAYLAGPEMPKPLLEKRLPEVGSDVAGFVYTREHQPGVVVRPGCEAKIIWANDSLRQQTEYVLLYLHGFSASRREGYPVNETFASRYGCNAFLPRLADHGLVTSEPLLGMTPDALWLSAREALAVAGKLGKKVIIMGCSTGCTLALQLAADFPESIAGLILYSPNIQIKQKTAVLLGGPWGLQIARLNFGGKYRVLDDDPNGELCRYWYCRYRAEAPVYLQQLLDATMNKATFSAVKCPVFVGYYYKDEEHQDKTVEVKATLKMFDQLGTPASQKQAVAFPLAGDHVIACDLTSKSVKEVMDATDQFAGNILGMQPAH
ncbi:MAG: alpha/beta hydrolase [Marinilabiliales bacterium]|nr:alpha/beta hydrolase [Marinilabiliales bacterium]